MRKIAASAACWAVRGRISLLVIGALMLVAPATASATIVAASQTDGSTLVAQNTGTTSETDCASGSHFSFGFENGYGPIPCQEPTFSGATWSPAVTSQGGRGNGAYYQMPGSQWVGQYDRGAISDWEWTQFKTTFDRPAGASLGIRVLVDNQVTGIWVNGNQLSSCTRANPCDGFNHLPFAFPIPDTDLQDTGNQLQVTVLNDAYNAVTTGGLDYQVVTRGPDVANLPAPNVTGAAGGTLTASGSFQESFQADQTVPVTLTADNTVGTFKDNGNGTWTWTYPNATGPASGTIHVTSTDANGRSSTESFNYSVAAPPDSTPPVIAPTVTGTQGTGGWYTSDIGVSWSVTDPQSAISSQSGCGNQSVTTDTAGVTFTCTATSAGGTASKSVTVKRDATAPAVSVSHSADGQNGWNKSSPVTETVSASDSGSGLAGTPSCSVDGTSATLTPAGAGSWTFPVSGDGSHAVSCGAADQAGNISGGADTVNLDATPPSVSVSNQPNGQNGWSTASPVTETVKPADGGSGLAGAPSCTVDGSAASLTDVGGGSWTFPISGDGQHAVSCSASDQAGNQGSGSDTAKIDTQAPSTSATGVPAGWVNHDVTVNLSASDPSPGSGVAGTHYTVDGGSTQDGTSVTLSDEGTHQVSYWSVDNAGNTEAKNSATVKIDKTPPAVSVSHSVDGKNGWNVSSPVTDTVKASDGGSGLAGAPTCSIDGQDASVTASGDSTWTVPVSGDGTHSVSCSASDNAGNSGSGADTTNIDTTPPQVTYTGNAGTYTVADSVSISCSASDPTPGSGLAGSTCQNISGDAYTFSLGTNSYTATGTDNAGNVGKGQTSFKVTVDSGSLCALTKRWVSKPGIAGALCAKLDAAGASIARGDTNSKNGQLDAYRNQLSAQSGKSIAADKAAILTKLSQAL